MSPGEARPVDRRTSAAGQPPASGRLARLDLRADRAGTVALAILVAVTTLLATAAPVVFTRAADAALPAMIAAAPPLNRDFGLSLDGYFQAERAAPLADVSRRGEMLQDGMPASIRELFVGRIESATTEPLAALGLTRKFPLSASLRLRAQEGVDGEATYLRGRAPRPRGSSGTDVGTGDSPGYEIAISTETAEWLDQDVGATFPLAPDRGQPIEAEIVGVFEARDPDADYWADRALLQPTVVIEGDSDFVEVRGTALLATDDYPAVLEDVGGVVTYLWRFLFDWQRADAVTRERVAGDVAALRSRYPFRGSTVGSDEPSLSTGIGAILERYLVERSAAQAAMTLALVGPAAAALGALGMIAAMIARRRHTAVLLVRARGALDRHVIVSRSLVGTVIIVPATLAPAIVVVALAGPGWAAGVTAIAAAVAVVTLGLVVAAAAQLLRGSGGELRQTRPTVWWGGPRSLVRDGLLIAVAIAGVLWIGQRGAIDAAGAPGIGLGTGSGPAGTDPLIILVPVLVALAGGLIAWRCYVPLVRLAAGAAAAHPGFVPVHALRGPSRGAGALQVPLVVLVVIIAVGVFSAIVLLSLQRQQAVVAYLTVGADYRVESVTRANLPVRLELPGTEAEADMVIRDGVLSGGSVQAMAVSAAALDAEGYRRVVAGTPSEGAIPAVFTGALWDETSGMTPETAIPAVLVGEAARRPALAIGDPFVLSALGRASHFRVAAILPEFPGATSPRGTVIVPLAAVTAADPAQPFFPNQTFVRAPPDQAGALLEATVGSYGAPNVALISRAAVRAAMDRDPLVRDTSIGFVLATLVAVAFAALVVAVAVVRDVTSRAHEIALLRALGTRPGQVLGVIIVEQGTVVASAVVGGLAIGCVMGVLAVPGLGLDRFVRPGLIVDAAIDWPVVSGVAAGQALLALLVMVAATAVARRRAPVPAMMRDA